MTHARYENVVEALRDVEALLQAISDGGCFDALPRDPADHDEHCRGARLLMLAHDRARECLNADRVHDEERAQ